MGAVSTVSCRRMWGVTVVQHKSTYPAAYLGLELATLSGEQPCANVVRTWILDARPGRLLLVRPSIAIFFSKLSLNPEGCATVGKLTICSSAQHVGA